MRIREPRGAIRLAVFDQPFGPRLVRCQKHIVRRAIDDLRIKLTGRPGNNVERIVAAGFKIALQLFQGRLEIGRDRDGR